MSNVQPPGDPLQRIRADSLSVAEFLQRYFYPNTPVILTHAIEDWPALDWEPQGLKSLIGEQEFEVRTSDSGLLFDNLYGDSPVERMAFSCLVDTITRGQPHKKFYLAQQPLKNVFPDYQRYICRFPFFRKMDQIQATNFWFGDAGCITPLHFDFQHNYFAQIYGRKEFIIFAPHDRPYLYPNMDLPLFYFISKVSPHKPNTEEFPEFAKATPVRFVLQPSEVLFLPCGWWHFVRTLDISISINHWWTRMFSRNTVQLSLILEFLRIYVKTKLIPKLIKW